MIIEYVNTVIVNMSKCLQCTINIRNASILSLATLIIQISCSNKHNAEDIRLSDTTHNQACNHVK